jgi:hypothetical protein
MTKPRHYIHIILLGLALLLAGLQVVCFAAETITVQALAEKQEVTVGESFLLQIKIDGDDSPAEPDLSSLQEFTVEPKGGGQNNRESITIINGKINRVSEHGYVFQYLLTPKSDGIVTIPAIQITAGGKTLLTEPIPIRVIKPVVSDEFMLRVSFSETEPYVGQPIILTVKWYVNRNIAEFKFDLPFLEDQRFTFADLPADSNYQGQDAISLNLPGGTVIARKGQEGQHTTVTLRKVLIPREPGEFNLGRGAVSSKIITGYQQKRPGQPFGDFFNRDLFDNMFGRRQAVYQQLVTESNDLKLKVLPLPAENRPAAFTGLVGQYSIAAEANPTEVNVGDPITLNIMVTGAEFMDNVVLPHLGTLPGIRDNFKVPEEMGPGEIDGRVKVFTQTIRAKHANVKEIPSIDLNYYNPETRQYESTGTKAISLQVNATKIVTARDAEGISPGMSKKEIASLNKGIAHNYVGEEILENQDVEVASWFSSPIGLILIMFPPGAYLLVLVPVFFKRKRLQDAETLQARKAFSEFSKEVAKLQKEIYQSELQRIISGLVEAMRIYLSKRLLLPPGALVYKELADRLQQCGVDSALLAELQKILDLCEAYRYGAIDREGSGRENLQEMLVASLELFKKIEQSLQK